MPSLKCKMCGGDLVVTSVSTVCECEYCGSKQTIPTADNEKKLTLFARANRLRFNSEFDKAAGIYESIVADFPEEAEAYWGLVLCKYGIEYVDDPVTAKKVPTCHRSSFDSVLDDHNFDMACEYAEPEAKRLYREEAKAIETIRKGIIEVSGKEEPYDIFICYKETADDGNRTLDSVLAQDIYTALAEKGYRVFFSRITLEDKLGQEYEPYIFAALHSARIMLAVGTQFEYYDAVWVKNEWSRYLKLIEAGEKKTLIPCFRNLDPYDMPKEFAKLQAQDLGKVGAMQDLLRGIEKILGRKKEEKPSAGRTASGPDDSSLLKRGFLFAEDGEWTQADTYCERALDINPENGEAYLLKLLLEFRVPKMEALAELEQMFYLSSNYKKCLRYASSYLATKLEEIGTKRKEQRDSRIQATVKEKEKEITAIREKCRALQQPVKTDQNYNKIIAGILCIGAGLLFSLLTSYVSEGFSYPAGILFIIGVALLIKGKTADTNNDEEIKRLEAQAQQKQDELDIYKQDMEMETYTTPSKEANHEHSIRPQPINNAGNSQNMTLSARSKAYRQALLRMKSSPEILKAVEARQKVAEIAAQYENLSLFNRKEKKRLQEQFESLKAESKRLDGQAEDAMAELSRFYFGSVRPVFQQSVNDCINLINLYLGNETECRFGEVKLKSIFSEQMPSTAWQVLHRDDESMLLLSKERVEVGRFDVNKGEWGVSEIKSWLNGTFINAHFTEVQRKIVRDNGVFLLSVEEAGSFFKGNNNRNINAEWWLRTQGKNRKKAAFVTESGRINANGKAKDEFAAIRPAIRIKM